MNSLFTTIFAVSEKEQIIMIAAWIIIIVLAIIAEAETAEFVSCWFVVGGVLGLILDFFKVDIYIQILSAVIISIILILISRPLVKKLTKNDDVPTNADRIKGMVGVVIKEIKAGEKGLVKVNYQTWTAISKTEKTFREGEKVLIKEIEGNKLIIDKIEEIEIK